ncbi:hypothetical protein TCAL_10587 [Tigriopus californicus]|uniref:Uncharacterized protein n=1 Tax=Tigriopus californicus TaxID=6832 RepID=A0A553P8J5_TIGCA|nr:ras-related protein Rab-13-like [Tigriopus californicus]TRY73986.1 hypothetical protein TCAL_10587 [Tigriopus californicus]|eukprot:TCALIF_10587-PA protein Name:"Similar to rab13 Ras-related protein Rab-13 (Danio rerio)" AED:0.11 eAED:0.11 QI:78/1/0.5/1/1/1/2/0/218
MVSSFASKNDHLFPKVKVLMLGDAGVGKTSISRRLTEEEFHPSYVHTVGIDFFEKAIQIHDQIVRLQLWDTAGQERFHSLIRPYYRGASGVVLVYDVTDRNSFNNIQEWMETLRENLNLGQITDTLIMGNKTDLVGRRVSSAEGRTLAQRQNCAFAEVSAKDGNNLETSFMGLAQRIWNRRISTVERGGSPGHQTRFETIELNAIPLHHPYQNKCCRK